MNDSFHHNVFLLLFLWEESFSVLIESISFFDFAESSDTAGSIFPTRFGKFRFPNFSLLGLLFLLSVVGVCDVFGVFHELSLNFAGLICGDIFWLSPNSSILIEFSPFFRILFFLHIFIRWFCQCFISIAGFKLSLMHAASGMHLFVILHFDLERISILITLVNAIWNAKVSFFSHSWTISAR